MHPAAVAEAIEQKASAAKDSLSTGLKLSGPRPIYEKLKPTSKGAARFRIGHFLIIPLCERCHRPTTEDELNNNWPLCDKCRPRKGQG